MNDFPTFAMAEYMVNSVVYGGLGMVGQATCHALGIEKYFDLKGSNISLVEASKLRYHFICLPTPVKDGRYLLDDIKALIKQILEYRGGQNVFIIRSTVIPGTCKHWVEELGTDAIVHVPEFLSEATWEEDAEHPDIVVVGCDNRDFREDVVGIYKARYKGVDIFETDVTTAELIKCARNAFYSTKVIFANEIYEIAQKVGANYETLKNALYASRWVGKNHLDVYYQRKGWDKPKRGLQGACLPKDMEALTEFSNSKLFKVIRELNQTYKT